MSEAPLRRPWRQRRWVRWTLGACVVLAAIALAAWFAAPWYVRNGLLPDLWARYGLTVTAERQDLSVADGTVKLHGVRISDGEEEVLTASQIEARIALRELYEGRTIFEHLAFEDPVLRARLESGGRTNVGKILARRSGRRAVSRPATLWEEVSLHRGTIEWDDPARGVTLRIVDIEAKVLDIETGRGERQDRFGQISIDANLEQSNQPPALLSIVYWTTSSRGDGPTFVAHLALTGIDLDSFPAYVDAAQRNALGVDRLDLVVSMDVREGVIQQGLAVATSPERTRPLTLRFGGRFDDPVFDRSSKLVALWELPFSRFGRVGDVVWETGSAVVGGVGGVIGGVGHGDLLGAMEAAVGGVAGGMLALGSNALDTLAGVGRTLGLVAPEEARDTKAIHARRRAVFLAARREAAETGSGAHSDPGS